MVAPSFAAITVPPGRHHIVFSYRPFPGTTYALLALLTIATLVGLIVLDRRARRQARVEMEARQSYTTAEPQMMS
jgi:prolipoprotein diacylglyceryltransferase